MMPGMGGMNPKKMQGLMKQLGMSQEEISAKKVTIEHEDNTKTIIENPSVTRITMQGQKMIQVAGGQEIQESPEQEISEQDIQTIIEKTGCSESQASETLKQTGDLAEAILQLSE